MNQSNEYDKNKTGLTTAEIQERLAKYGPNTVDEEKKRPFRLFLLKLWGPVPWMLEFTFILEIVLGKYTEAVIISALLILNAVLGFSQEHKAEAALELLRKRLRIFARVLRNGAWNRISAEELVPDDIVHVRMGDLVPADLSIMDGNVLIDQSVLTGESQPVERTNGEKLFSGSIVKRGEATGKVNATGASSYFGKTAELVRTAKTTGHLAELIFRIVKYLVAMDVILVIAIFVYAMVTGINLVEILPFALILLVASVPVALPATFTLATAIASLTLTKRGVLVTHLSAIEDAASMEELCSDKTGTLTLNTLSLAKYKVFPPFSDAEACSYAVIASNEATQDPIDLAIINYAKSRIKIDTVERINFIPFDPATKRAEAVIKRAGITIRVVKGAPSVIAQLISEKNELIEESSKLEEQGYRVLAVAVASDEKFKPVCLLALSDPPRHDSKSLLEQLKGLGIKVRMVTGDSTLTAKSMAKEIGLGTNICTKETINNPDDCDVFAGVFPEDKFYLVKALQKQGKITGMTGDGVNDAPALKQAEVGIAVSNATDVAKAAASLVLTQPGLVNLLDAIKTGRMVYQRMLTYTINKISKTFQISLFLSLGLLFFGVFVTTPRLVLLLLFANDFVTMSLSNDRVGYSSKPDKWNVPVLIGISLVVAGAWLAYSFGVYAIGHYVLRMPLSNIQTFVFLSLVFSGQATVYLVREREHLWYSRPATIMLLATSMDLVIVSIMAVYGILMTPIPFTIVMSLLFGTFIFMLILDLIKVPLMHRNGFASTELRV